MAQEVWTQNELTLKERTYGVKSRLRRFRWEYPAGKPLGAGSPVVSLLTLSPLLTSVLLGRLLG